MLDANLSNKCHLSLPIKKKKKKKKKKRKKNEKEKRWGTYPKKKKKMLPELVVHTSWFK